MLWFSHGNRVEKFTEVEACGKFIRAHRTVHHRQQSPQQIGLNLRTAVTLRPLRGQFTCERKDAIKLIEIFYEIAELQGGGEFIIQHRARIFLLESANEFGVGIGKRRKKILGQRFGRVVWKVAKYSRNFGRSRRIYFRHRHIK